jgi:hypothetical protein
VLIDDASLQESAVTRRAVAEADKNGVRVMKTLGVVWVIDNRILWAYATCPFVSLTP